MSTPSPSQIRRTLRTGRHSLLTAWGGLCLAASAQAQAPAAPEAVPTLNPAASAASGNTGPSGNARLEEVLGQSGGLTARDAGRRAAQTSVQASVEGEKVLSARNDGARVIWDNLPKLTLSAQYTRLSAVDTPVILGVPPGFSLSGPLDNYALSANLTVPFTEYLLRVVTALRGAGDNEEAAALTERATRVGAAANAKLTYYDWVRARLQRVVTEQALDQAKAQLRRVEALRSAGRAAEADLLQARAFQADAELALSQADTLAAIGEQRLRTIVHAPLEEQLSVGENVLAAFPGAQEPKSLDGLCRRSHRAAATRASVQPCAVGRARRSPCRRPLAPGAGSPPRGTGRPGSWAPVRREMPRAHSLRR